MRVRSIRRTLCLSISAALLSSCASTPPLSPVPEAYARVILRTGLTDTCPNSRKPGGMFPGMGGDSVILARGNDQRIFDVGDVETGPTLKNHDRLYIKNAAPDKFDISRAGHSLLMCAPGEGYAVTILRQYCGSGGQAPLWNNTIEEITFMSGETWLADDLYDDLGQAQPYITAGLIADKKLGKVNATEIENWQYHSFSEKLPRAGRAAKACRADEKMMQARGYME